MQTFWSHGYGATSPALLGDATGLGRGSLYNAFGSKRELFLRCLDRYDAETTAAAEGLLGDTADARAAILALFYAVIDADLDGAARRGCLVGNTATELAGSDPEIADRVATIQNRTIDGLRARVAQGVADGSLPASTDPRAAGEFLATTLAGLRVLAMTQDRATLRRGAELAVAHL